MLSFWLLAGGLKSPFFMKSTSYRLANGLLLATVLFSTLARAEYHYFSNVQSGSDGIVQEIRWPYWNNTYYNTWLSDDWTSTEGTSGYFYNGLALPAAGSPNPVTTQQTINWSFWPLSSPVNITDTIHSGYTSPNTFSMPTIGEGTIFRSPGLWTAWQTNVWYRLAFRTWQPVSAAPHQGYAGTWLRDPVTGAWYHMATVQLPFTVTGIDGLMGFQENATGGSQPQRTDYRNCYYHKNGAWNSGNQFYIYNHGGGIENVGLIETNTAVYYETCKSNGVYTGSITNTGQSSPTFTITQPAAPTFFDPILVTNYGATVTSTQLVVQWQMAPNSSPQFAYQIDVYTNASYTGTVALTFFDIAPDARQKLLNLPGVTTPFPKLTVIDIFNQTNAPIGLTPTNVSLLAATSVPGAVNGLGYAYYESASNVYGSGSGTNWSSMPNFAALTPVYNGAVNNLDLSARRRRDGYAFNYTGYINVPTSGLYTFTLNSDAGSKLFVDGQPVVNWDGEHSPSDLSGWIGLQPGYHLVNVQYFCDTQPTGLFSDYFDTLTLSYEGPGIAKTIVPDSAFVRVPGGEPVVSITSPTNGAVTSGASVSLSAAVTANGNTINNVQFYVGNNYWAQDAAAPYNVSSFFWNNNNNPIRARVFYNGTNVIDSAANSVTTTNMTLAPWQFGQIFYHNYPNGASIASGTYSLIGDGMNLLTRQVSGDCTLIAHLSGLPSTAAKPDGSTPSSGWQAGIIIRGNTNMVPGYPWGQTGTAPFTAVFGQVDGGAYYQDETMVNGGGGYSSSNLGGQKWFKLQRVSNTFTSSVSADGVTWIPVNTNTLTDFGTTVYAGFFTYAGPSANPSVHWASFNNVSLTGNLVGPPGVAVIPQAATIYAGQTQTLTAVPSGNAPFTYQWQYNNLNINGATNSTLNLTNVQASASGLYTVILNNSNGTAAAAATLTVLTAPPATAQILSNNPTGYWRLNETAGPTAFDSAGSFNGTGEGGLVFGVPGVTNFPFTGFESGNLGAQFNGTDADVSIPGINFNTTNFTITGWVKCNGAQTSWSGLVFSRGSGYGTGLMVDNNGSNVELRYSWNDNGGDYNFSTGLNLPTNGVWAFVALTIEPTRAIIYMATNSVLTAKTNTVTNSGRTFGGSFYFGYDPNSSSRRFNGTLDEIAIYNRTLTPAQISQIVAAAQQALPPAISLISPVSGTGYGTPATINLSTSVATNGHGINYVQFYNGANLLGISSNAPYGFYWTNVSAGAYTLFAQLVYDTTNVISSAPAFVSVNPIPATPATVTATALATNLVSVTWSAASYAASYILSRNGNVIGAVSGTNYLDLGLVAGSNYCYSVVASNSYGSSAASTPSCVITPASGGAFEWDAGGIAGAQDGNGTWGGSSATWWNGAANIAWSDNKLAVFGAGTTTNSTATITNDVAPSGILFNANNGGNYDVSSSANGTSHLILSGAVIITANNDATIDAYLKGGGQLIKSGPGTLTISGGNTNTGAVIVNGGRLLATGGGWYANRSIGSGSLIVSNGAVAEFSVAHGFGAGAGGYSATLSSGGTLQFDHENYVSGLTLTAGVLMGAGEIRTTGGTYSTLAAANPSVISLPVNFVSGGTFNIARGTGSADLLATGYAYDTGALTKSGAGIMAISGAWTNSGTTTISAGTLQIDGSLGTNTVSVANNATLAGVGVINGATIVNSGGTIAPGDAGLGKLVFGSSVALNSGSKCILELSKNGGVLSNDLLSVTGTLTLGGTLTVTNIGTNALAAGDSFDLFNASSFSGNFSGKNLPALATNLVWDTTQWATSGVIFVGALPVITNQPQSLAVNLGGPAGFSVGASGSPILTYQWCKNSVFFPGANTTSYHLSSVSVGDAASYTVVITNNYGSVTSLVATLMINPPPGFNGLGLLSNGAFSLIATGAAGGTCVLLGTTNLQPPIGWLPLTTNTADTNGLFNFSDAQATNFSQRFYRLLTQ
jgi:autotransporter-associated beta strand protein